MFSLRVRTALLAVIGTAALAGCATYDRYGYSGVSLGYGSRYYGSPYGYGYNSPYYGSNYYGNRYYGNRYYGSRYYGSPYSGWYNGFYYPGQGVYVYDRYRRAHRWNDTHRRHWQDRRRNYTSNGQLRDAVRQRLIQQRDQRRDRRRDRD